MAQEENEPGFKEAQDMVKDEWDGTDDLVLPTDDEAVFDVENDVATYTPMASPPAEVVTRMNQRLPWDKYVLLLSSGLPLELKEANSERSKDITAMAMDRARKIRNAKRAQKGLPPDDDWGKE